MEELPETLIMDFDLDASWTFDQIFSIEDWPPVILSAIDQPSSPVRTFSENNNNNNLVDGDAEPVEYAPLTSFRASRTIIANPMPIFEVNPTQYADATSVIKEQMTMALHYFKELGEKHILAQIWAPVKNGGCNVLTTCGQPFVLDPNCTGLHQYRMASSMYVFPLDSETDGVLDIPGRVFRHKLPEWTPNVQYYSDKEYQRLDHALNYNVRGTLALPVFEPSGQSCVGVLELILTSQKINYAPEVDKVCKALEAVNLKSSNILDSPNTQICNESRQQALAEILEVLAVVCETHNFPLAQTWVPCRHRSVLAYGGGFKKSCNSFDGSCMGQVCMSTTDVAFYVVDAHMWGFREACAEHHLQKGQGVAGRAFAKRSSCFCENITHFGKTEYPLVHYARMFGLVGSFAICLRSTHTGDDDYILEFFLPPYIIDCKDQKVMLSSVLALMKQHFRTLEFASGKELDDELRILDIEDSSRSQIEFSMTFERNRSATLLEASEEGRRSIDKECRTPSTEKYKTAPISLPQEDIEQQFGRTMKEAANNLNVSLSTLKRRCTYFGISEWQGPKFVKRKVNETDKGATRDSLAIDGGMQVDKNTLIIKAEYADDLIKFQLPISLATVVAIEKEICDRFKLSRETYKLKYKDEDEEWILMTYDQDLRDCIKSLKNSNSTAIRLRVIPLI